MKKLLIVFLCSFIAMTLALYVSRSINKLYNSPKPLTSEQIKKQLIKGLHEGAKTINRKTPMMVDDYTRLDSVIVGPGLRANYNYTFTKFNSNGIDLKLLKNKIKNKSLEYICNNIELEEMLKNGGVFHYSYFGNDGKELLEFAINMSNCK